MPSRADTRSRRRLLGGAVGTFVEWYDFLVYGLSAGVLADHFFPSSNSTASLLGALAVFGVAFMVRPLGAMLFGHFGDRHSRIKMLSLTVLLMGAATMLIGLLPTYGSIGLAAPLLLVLCRVIQGLSAGGEHSGAMAYVVESAPEDRRGRWIGIVFAMSFLPNTVVAILILVLQSWLGESAYADWAWRLPFVMGGIVATVGLVLRLRLSDPEEFVEASRKEAVQNPLKAAATRELRPVVTVILLVAPSVVPSYLLIAYIYVYLTDTVGLDTDTALTSNAAAGLLVAALVPLAGTVADRLGRKPVMFAGAVWLTVTSVPAFAAVGSGTATGAYLGQVVLAIGISIFVAGSDVTMTELFRTSVRYSGHALAYSLGTALFGGTTPFVAGAVAEVAGPLAPAYLVAATALAGLIVVWFTPETRHFSLRTAEAKSSERPGSTNAVGLSQNQY